MICVECSTPIRTLYDKYKGNHIRLTICEKCNKVADRYIEFDKVLLFIDLMLLKPQAYKHTIYNMSLTIDNNLVTSDAPSELDPTIPVSGHKMSIFARYGLFLRLLILMLLFEVYLTWAYEEKNYMEDVVKTSLTIKLVLDNRTILLQYAFFLSKAILDSVVLHGSLQLMVYYFLGFGTPTIVEFQYIASPPSPAPTQIAPPAQITQKSSPPPLSSRSRSTSTSSPPPIQLVPLSAANLERLQVPKLERSMSTSSVSSNHAVVVNEVIVYSREYFMGIISTTLLISNLIKLFPIVMLIWPYDTFILNVTKTVVQIIHLVILVEAIHIVLLNNENNQYWKIAVIVLCSQVIKFLTSHLIIVSVFMLHYNVDVKLIFMDEFNQIKLKLQLIYQLLQYVGI
ncbi:hypothetical protein CANARDRAFT_160520 [[Candida] arabinofermentans NRRL YB-2248]|uniref:Protein ARV n=1 Tax=[Candida] arabinofermentans NRRL YB-2248 TaxID=983967 RepID=A0A1E4T0H5_9ASCO|nr:hypothetical protein CANARDRAFT_160520 [[Candida] arabinofermentans NRRL YB-2248]